MSLRAAAAAFVDGYRCARPDGLEPAEQVVRAMVDRLEAMPIEVRPFACEGVAMALRLRDEADDGDRLAGLAHALGPVWLPLVQLGEGCALARLNVAPPMEPMVADGFGFECGRKDGTRVRSSHPAVAGAPAKARTPASAPDPSNAPTPSNADHLTWIDRGRGRALWFVTDGRLEVCARLLAGCDATVAAPFWRGIGTACVFAGDPHDSAIRLRETAGPFADEVAAGADYAWTLWSALTDEPPARVTAVRAVIART